MNLKTRIKLICFGMATVLTLCSGVLYGAHSVVTLHRNTIESIEGVTNQTTLLFDNLIDSMNQISLMPLLNPNVYNILRKHYGDDTTLYDRYNDEDIMANYMYNSAYYYDKRILGITYVSLCSDIMSYRNKVGASPNIDNFKSRTWVTKLLEEEEGFSFFVLEEDDLYPNEKQLLCLARVVKDSVTDELLGIIRVDTRLHHVEQIWDNAKLREDFGIEVISNKSDHIILADGVAADRSQRYIPVESVSKTYDYKIINRVPTTYLYRGVGKLIVGILLFMAIAIILAFHAADLLSKKIMKPIKHLNACMKEVEKGNLTVRTNATVGGEFGQVCRSFDKMVHKTEELIDKIYIGEEEKRKAEFKALQAQISPHFLLNTLNTIRWMAVLQGSKPIVNAMENLTKILSFTFRDGREKITIKDEVEQIKYYIEILTLRYPNRFKVELNVEPATEQCLTLKYLLQPFIENSIFHGFKGVDYEGTIRVNIRKVEQAIEYEIMDNGQGMNEEELTMIQKTKRDGKKGFNRIGVRNVVDRVAMAYGKDYGVLLESEKGHYTKVKIRIPIEY